MLGKGKYTLAMGNSTIVIIVWVFAGASVLTATGIGGVLIYHWLRFSLNSFVRFVGPLIFLCIASFLLFILFAALLVI